MKLTTFLLLFLFCNGSVNASERNRDSGRLVEKTRVMMDEINRILKDFYNSIQDTQRTYDGGGSRYHDEIKPKPYSEPSKSFGGAVGYSAQQKHHDPNMRYFDLQERSAALRQRSQEIKKHLQEVNKLKDEWLNRKSDRDAYQRYMAERGKYLEELAKHTEAVNAYKQDINKHNDMRKMRTGG